MNPLGFSIYKTPFVNKTILALPFQFEYFFTYFSYLIVLTITSFIMLNKSDENWHPFLVPGCRGSLQFFIAAWKDWCWSLNSSTLATWCEELILWKITWCWERLKAGGEGDNRGLDGWMASPTRWTCVWASSSSWWWTGRPGVLQSMGSQPDMTERLNWMYT